MKRFTCKCGQSFNTLQEWNIHRLIGRPNLITASSLTHITEEQAQSRLRAQEKYDEDHQLISFPKSLKF